jgi:hypothetical protein
LLEFLEEATSVVDSGEGFEVVYLDKGETDEKSLSTWHTGTCLGLDQQLAERKETESGAKWQILHLGGGALRRPPGQCAWTTASVLFINDMDAVVQQINILRKLADDTKLGKTGVTETDRDELQEALNQLCTWADTWGMQFNVAKCTVMHMGHKNPKHVYQMNGQELEVTAEERDIGVMVADNLKPSAQCAKAARTAQSVLGQLTRAFHYRDRHIFIRLYKQYVRPHLEFSTQAWAPWTEADKSCLERMQQRAVRMVSGLAGKAYEECSAELGQDILEERRHQATWPWCTRSCTARANLIILAGLRRQRMARGLPETRRTLSTIKRF